MTYISIQNSYLKEEIPRQQNLYCLSLNDKNILCRWIMHCEYQMEYRTPSDISFIYKIIVSHILPQNPFQMNIECLKAHYIWLLLCNILIYFDIITYYNLQII